MKNRTEKQNKNKQTNEQKTNKLTNSFLHQQSIYLFYQLIKCIGLLLDESMILPLPFVPRTVGQKERKKNSKTQLINQSS